MANEAENVQGGAAGIASTQAATSEKKEGSILSQVNNAQTAEGGKPKADGSLLGGVAAEQQAADGTKPSEQSSEKKAEGEAAKAADEKKAETTVPEKYEFKVPEGMQLDEKMIEAFTPIAKELGLSNEQAQKFADLYAGKVKEIADGQAQKLNAIRSKWQAEITKDPNWKETAGYAWRTLNKFATPEEREYFGGEKSLIADNPLVVNFLSRIGKLVVEDKFIEGSPAGSTKSDAEIFYPNKK